MSPTDPLDTLDLPPAPQPVGLYVRGLICGGMGLLSGQLPFRDGVLTHRGLVGAELTREEGRAAAAVAARNAVAAIKTTLGGSFARFGGLLRVEGYVAGAPGFADHAFVLDGASQVLTDLLADRGTHTRSAIGAAHLPLGTPVELVVTFAVRA